MTDNTELEDVLRAVRYLDEHLGTPSWVHDVPLDGTLDLMECDACVLYHAGGRDSENSYLELSFALQAAHPDEPDRFWDVFADNDLYRERWIMVLTHLQQVRPRA